MGERKVVNKYIPWDFDPRLIPPRVKPKNDQIKIRMMVPMTIQCVACGEFIYKGKKFNARKEDVAGELYLGLKIFRFYIRCPRCAAEITIKTDPKNSDYVCETGATRNFEAWREERTLEEEAYQKKKEEEDDAMKSLESRTFDSKAEMELLDDLEEIRMLNAQNQAVQPEDLVSLQAKKVEEEIQKQNEDDEQIIREAFRKHRSQLAGGIPASTTPATTTTTPATTTITTTTTTTTMATKPTTTKPTRTLLSHDDNAGGEDAEEQEVVEEEIREIPEDSDTSGFSLLRDLDFAAPAPKRQKTDSTTPVPQQRSAGFRNPTPTPKPNANSTKKSTTGSVVLAGTTKIQKKRSLVNY